MMNINKDKKYPKHVFNVFRPNDFNPGSDTFDNDEQAALAMAVYSLAQIHDVHILSFLGDFIRTFAGKTAEDYPALFKKTE